MKSTTWVWVVAVIIIVAGVAWWHYDSTRGAVQMTSGTQTQTTSTTSIDSSTAPMTATVTYTNSGFSPASVTVAQGGTVTWVNQSDNSLWVASDPHPTHTGYDGTDRATHCAPGYTGATPFDECTSVPSGGSYTFTFGKTGSWGYHNHDQASDTGTVVVQ